MTEEHPPQDIPVTFNLRLPWVYKRQLEKEAAKLRVSLHSLVLDAIERRYPPK